mgnify:CR=1 FL=1
MEKKLSEIFLTRDTQRKDLPKEYFIYPYASDIESERELLEIADKAIQYSKEKKIG